MAERQGYRGYIGSRPLNGSRTPQHVQNIVIRDYAARKNLQYLLSAVEYSMPDSYMILEDIMKELPKLRGMICYSVFMLPQDPGLRRKIYDRFLGQDAELHAAVEEVVLRNSDDISRIEDILMVNRFATILGQ